MVIRKTRARAIAVAGVFLLFGGLLLILSGCGSYEHASKERSRYLINEGYLIPADQLRTADFLNYYQQHYEDYHPEETFDGEDINPAKTLSTYVTCRQIEDDRIITQIGLRTSSRIAKSEKSRKPLNLCVVVDKSGSMNDEHKMEYVKKGLELMVHRLNKSDILSFVTFDTVARVAVPPRRVNSYEPFLNFIDDLEPAGSTNLYDGLSLGYSQVEKNLSDRTTNHLVMITDAMLNTGEIDHNKVARMSEPHSREGIGLTVIGVGAAFNDKLMNQLSKQNSGNYFFLDSEKEIEKVFDKLLITGASTAVSELFVSLELKDGVYIDNVYGYDTSDYSLNINVNPTMSSDTWQTIMLELSASRVKGTLGYVNVSYVDEATGVTESSREVLKVAPLSSSRSLTLERNLLIVQEAEVLKQVWELVQRREYGRALQKIERIKSQLEDLCSELKRNGMRDAELQKDVELLERYQETIIGLARREGVDLEYKVPPSTDRARNVWRYKRE